jgi:GNAT superfamily N-acetyltransferase
MLTFTSARTDDPVAEDLLRRYFTDRSESFPDVHRGYTITMPDPEAFVPPAGEFLVVAVDGTPCGCGGVRRIADGVDETGDPLPRFEIKHLWLDPAVRGGGRGRALLTELERRAIGLGARRLVLDTHESLQAAGHLYRTMGYVSVEPYNDNPNATHWYAKDVDRPA